MIATDNNALICDFAETYHIYDYRGLPARYAAVLAVGLGEDSRTKRKLRGENFPTNTLLLAAINDTLNQIFWNGEGEPPQSIVDILMGNSNFQEREFMVFTTPEEYEEARRKIIES